jgi:arylformamidase
MDAEAEYVSRPMLAELRQRLPAWERDAIAYRAHAGARARIDVAYGAGPRQHLDVFSPERRGGAVALFVHGGYWQATGKAWFSHLARGANAHGVTVVMVGYTLCPDATVAGIVDEVRAAVAFAVKNLGAPVTVFGHSAGGHLAACMLATDWRARDLPADAVRAAMPVSGLFELEPLVATSVNRKLGLDAAEARRLSPIAWRPPAGRSMVAYVGGAETAEFRRQTSAFAERWSDAGAKATAVEVAGQGHFGVIDALAEPDSPMTLELVRLAIAG